MLPTFEKQKKIERTRVSAMYKCATTAEEDASTTTDGQAKRYCQKATSEKSIVWDRACEMHHVFFEEVQFRTNTMTALFNRHGADEDE